MIDRVVVDVGVDRGVAGKAIGTILDFLSKEGPADRVQSLLARLPDHQGLIAEAGNGGGMLGGMGGIMGVGASKRISAVRWGVAGNILTAWVLTIPLSAAFAFVVMLCLGAIRSGERAV